MFQIKEYPLFSLASIRRIHLLFERRSTIQLMNFEYDETISADDLADLMKADLAPGIEANLSFTSRNTYATALKKFRSDTNSNATLGSIQERHVFLKWGNKYMESHPRGGSQVGKTLASLIIEHLKAGIVSWGQSGEVRKWAAGWNKNATNICAITTRKVHTTVPVSLVLGLIKSASNDGSLWLALIYHVLFYGLPRAHHFKFFLVGDLFFPLSSEGDFIELYLGGIKTEGSIATGAWVQIPGARDLATKYLAQQRSCGAKRWDDLFPQYNNEHVNKYAQKFAVANEYHTLDQLTCHTFRGAGARYAQSELNLNAGKLSNRGLWTKDSSALQISYLSKPSPLVLQRAADVKFDQLTTIKRRFTKPVEVKSVTGKMLLDMEEDVKLLDQPTYHYFRKCMYLEQEAANKQQSIPATIKVSKEVANAYAKVIQEGIDKKSRGETRSNAIHVSSKVNVNSNVARPVGAKESTTTRNNHQDISDYQNDQAFNSFVAFFSVSRGPVINNSVTNIKSIDSEAEIQFNSFVSFYQAKNQVSDPVITSSERDLSLYDIMHEHDNNGLVAKKSRHEWKIPSVPNEARKLKDICPVCDMKIPPFCGIKCRICGKIIHRKCGKFSACKICISK
jgi:hypothetical protein